MNASHDENLLDDPQLPATELYRIASTRPDLAARIAAHPQVYPELLQWLGTLGDPEVDRVLASRQGGTRIHEASTVPMVERGPETTTSYEPFSDTSDSASSAPSANYVTVGASAPSAYTASPGYVAAGQQQTSQKRGISTGTGILLGIIIALILALIVMWQVLTGNKDSDDAAVGEDTTQSETTEATEADSNDSSTSSSEEATEEETTEEEPTEEEFTPGPYLPDATVMPVVSAPSGNIACAASEDGSWSCTIVEYNFAPPEGCSAAVTVYVSPEGETTIGCGLENQPGDQVLEYGQTARLADSAGCTSTEEGMRCWSGETNTGINIARAGITQITGP